MPDPTTRGPLGNNMSFSMDQKSWVALEALRETLQVDSAAEVIRQALTLLELAAKTTDNNGQVILREEDGTETTVQIGSQSKNIGSPRIKYSDKSHPQSTVSPLSVVPMNQGYEALLAYFRDVDGGTTALSPLRFCEVFNLDLPTLADQAHVHPNTLIEAPASKDVQHFLRQALQVLRAAFDQSGDIQKAAFWYRNEPLSSFNYKTAERLVSEDRTDDVLRYIVSLDAGATG